MKSLFKYNGVYHMYYNENNHYYSMHMWSILL